jgi:hypothetical protein
MAMTKADRADFDRLMFAYRKTNHYGALAIEQCIGYGMMTKTAALAELRAKEAEELAEQAEFGAQMESLTDDTTEDAKAAELAQIELAMDNRDTMATELNMPRGWTDADTSTEEQPAAPVVAIMCSVHWRTIDGPGYYTSAASFDVWMADDADKEDPPVSLVTLEEATAIAQNLLRRRETAKTAADLDAAPYQIEICIHHRAVTQQEPRK